MSAPAGATGPAPVRNRSTRLDVLQRRLGHEFADRALLRQAMVHRSYLNENPGEALESNERLEFLATRSSTPSSRAACTTITPPPPRAG